MFPLIVAIVAAVLLVDHPLNRCCVGGWALVLVIADGVELKCDSISKKR